MEKNGFRRVAVELCSLYERKNRDYGNSFSRTFEEFGVVAPVVRMCDKMERFKTLCKGKALVG